MCEFLIAVQPATELGVASAMNFEDRPTHSHGGSPDAQKCPESALRGHGAAENLHRRGNPSLATGAGLAQHGPTRSIFYEYLGLLRQRVYKDRHSLGCLAASTDMWGFGHYSGVCAKAEIATQSPSLDSPTPFFLHRLRRQGCHGPSRTRLKTGLWNRLASRLSSWNIPLNIP